MKYERYEPLLLSDDGREFKFTSTGPNGDITIVVQYNETNFPNTYNLAFGNLLNSGELDDLVKNCNQDRNKILATVAASVFEFTAANPGKYVFFTGSTSVRTRLYRMALTNNLSELGIDFEILGVNIKGLDLFVEPFKKEQEYYGFLIKRKVINLIYEKQQAEIEGSRSTWRESDKR